MLTLKNIKKSYDGTVILKDVNLDIQEGEIVSILGSSCLLYTSGICISICCVINSLHHPFVMNLLIFFIVVARPSLL